jgi:nucleoside-diphosphate-sugar epimerase
MRVLVTGATGFLGYHAVERLLARGHEPVALVREGGDTGPGSGRAALAALGVARVTGSLEQPGSIAPLLSGIDAVIHCAGGGRAGGGADLLAQNAGTTATLLQAIASSGRRLRRFVLISSLSAHGPSDDGHARPDDAPPQPRSASGRSKAEAERLALAARGDVPVTILRPPAIYGPGDDRWLSFFKAVRRGIIPVMGQGGSTSLVFGPDCAAAIALAIEVEHPSGRAYSIAEGPARTWEQLGAGAARALDARALPLIVPRRSLALLGAAAELASSLRGKPSFFSRDKAIDAAAAHWVCDPAPLRRELGWAPAVAFEREGAELTARWYRAQGMLP